MVYRRRSIRLKGYEYSQSGYYFVTLCTYNREKLLGRIKNERMRLNSMGKIVNEIWESISKHHAVGLDAFQIMPNHIHFIVVLKPGGLNIKGGSRPAPTLGMIVGFLKSESTKRINKSVWATRGSPGIWQRNYFEHIIRNEQEYWTIKKYIQDNPKNWEEDEMYGE